MAVKTMDELTLVELLAFRTRRALRVVRSVLTVLWS